MKRLIRGILPMILAVLLCGCSVSDLERLEAFLDSELEEQSEWSARSVPVTDGMTVTFVDVGQGDCTIVQTAGSTMMIDAGNNGKGQEINAYLESQGIEVIDYFILSHPDADHVGGADEVMRAVTVDTVIMPEVSHDTKTYEEVVEMIEQQNIEVIYPDVGDSYVLGDAVFTILCPEETDSEDLNRSSVGIKLEHGDNSFVMCADADSFSEERMCQSGIDLECDVLKVGHHGSSTSTSDLFLEATDPTWAVISCGVDNKYGHPHAEVVSKLEDEDVQIYRTDQLGAITAVSDGENLTWTSEK